MKKRILCLSLLLLIVISCMTNVYAITEEGMISKMKGGITADTGNNKLTEALGGVVALIQYAGSGIALLVMTLYGIKYMLASPY